MRSTNGMSLFLVGLEESFEYARFHMVCNYSVGVIGIVHYSVRVLKHAQL